MKRRVVVTGLGVVSSIGMGKDEFWKNLIDGKSGIGDIETFDTSEYPLHRGGEIKKFSAGNHLSKLSSKDMGRASQFAVIATDFALKDANIDINKVKNSGVVIGTTMADCPSLEQVDKHWVKEGEDDVWVKNIRNYPGYNLSNNIGFYFGIKGFNSVVPTACAAGNYTIGFAFDLIRRGKVDVMIAGGADPIARTNFTGFNRLIAIAPDKCQPFDKNRKGMMVGEGAGVLILETLESARKRKAQIHAEVLGYGLSCDAHNMTIPSVDGLVKSMERAIKKSEIRKEDVDYICAHGTGTFANDKAECEATYRVFGEKAKEIPVSSIKSMLGHTMGAASAIEAIACCLAIKTNIIPPTINFETPDPECVVDCVPNVAREKEVSVVLNNAWAFGGNNACLVLTK